MQDFSFEDEFALRVLFSAGYRNNIALAFETSVMTMQFLPGLQEVNAIKEVPVTVDGKPTVDIRS